MKSPTPVLCSAIALPDAGVPDWVHLLPAGVARTVDGRGPYRIPDAAALMAASLSAGHKLAVDENHSTDIAAPQGKPSPARGWIVELQSRDDGIWGKVDWTGPGRRMMEDREYRGLSPVITHDRAGTVTGILRASLTNVPNLAGLVALHHQENEDMALRDTLIGALGLDGGADDAAIVAAVTAAKDGGGQVALQSALAPIAKVAGLPETSDAAAVLAGVQQLAGASDERVTELQSSLTTATAQIKTLADDAARTSTSIDNGTRLPVECQNFSGIAGVRLAGEGGEFACPRTTPSAVQEGSGTVDGRPVRILSVRKSDITEGMIVIRFAFEEEQA